MPLYLQGNSLLQKGGKLGTSAGCCCKRGICGSSCSGRGLPQQLKFSITSCDIDSADISFNPVGDWIIDLHESCSFYVGRFYELTYSNWTYICPYPSYGCNYKLQIALFLNYPTAGITVRICDRTPKNYYLGGFENGGKDLNTYETLVCNRDFPITGTIPFPYCRSIALTYSVTAA
jgi:hypothetical protein